MYYVVKLKKNILKNSFVELFNNYKLITIKGNNTATEQPFGIINTFKCAKMRLKNVNDYSYAISIENGVLKMNMDSYKIFVLL